MIASLPTRRADDQARDAGINVVELNEAQMSAAKQIVYDKEWPSGSPRDSGDGGPRLFGSRFQGSCRMRKQLAGATTDEMDKRFLRGRGRMQVARATSRRRAALRLKALPSCLTQALPA